MVNPASPIPVILNSGNPGNWLVESKRAGRKLAEVHALSTQRSPKPIGGQQEGLQNRTLHDVGSLVGGL